MRHSVFLFCGLMAAMFIGCRHNSDRVATGRDADPTFAAYCRSLDYADTISLRDDSVMGERMAALFKEMAGADSADVREGLAVFFNSLKHDGIALTLASAHSDLILNSQDSSLRDRKRYVEFLEALLDVDSLPDYVRTGCSERLRIARLNSPGSIAGDLKFEDRDGTVRTLYSLGSRGDNAMRLLVFYDPECRHCSEVVGMLAADARISEAVASGRLMVAAVYAEGDRTVWDRTKHEMPSSWIVGYDLSGVVDNEIYDLSVIPAIYLLDSTNRVVMKEPTPDELLIKIS